MFFLIAIIVWLFIFFCFISLIIELYKMYKDWREEEERKADLKRFRKMYRVIFK